MGVFRSNGNPKEPNHLGFFVYIHRNNRNGGDI